MQSCLYRAQLQKTKINKEKRKQTNCFVLLISFHQCRLQIGSEADVGKQAVRTERKRELLLVKIFNYFFCRCCLAY